MFAKRCLITVFFILIGFCRIFAQSPLSYEPFDPLSPSFPASVPAEIQAKILNPGNEPAVTLRSASSMAAPPFSEPGSGYYLLDSIQSYSPTGTILVNLLNNPSAYVGLPWMPIDDFFSSDSPNPTVISRGLVASPFSANTPGSFALRQTVNGTTYSYCNERRIGKTFSLGGLNGPNARLAFYLSVNRYCSSCYYDTAGVQVFLFRDNSLVGHWAIGTGGGWTIPGAANTTSLPNGFSGFVELPLNFAGQFDKITVTALNYACYGNNATCLDEIYFKPDLPMQVVDVEAAPDIRCCLCGSMSMMPPEIVSA